MYKMKRPLFIHFILIYFTLLYSHNNNLAYRTLVYASNIPSLSISKPTQLTNSEPLFASDTITDENREFIRENFKQIAKEKLFDFKGKPDQTADSKTTNTKFYVPRAMLEKYLEYRDTVREFIPNDRDFYGKINIEDLDGVEEDFWGAVYNKYGSYDIQVDMRPQKRDLERGDFKADASHIACIEVSRDPEDVPAKIEPLLPPHARSIQSQRKFQSVHLHFRLDQEVYKSPTALEDLKGAELHLERDKITDCELRGCDDTENSTESSSAEDQPSSENVNTLKHVPRYQRVYVLQVNGYDQFGEPKTRIITSTRIDIHRTSPLVFNVYEIVKEWIENPSSNYGVIVRIANDDPDFDHGLKLKSLANNSQLSLAAKREVRNSKSTNASETSFIPSVSIYENEKVVEHVRLKRGFRSSSDDEATWIRKRPKIYVYSKPIEKQHVKRHNEGDQDGTEGMQADDPEATTLSYQQTSYSTTTVNSGLENSSIDKPTGSQIQISTLSGPVKRENIPNMNHSSRRGTTSSRGSGNGRTSTSSGSNPRPNRKQKPSPRQPEKCSKRSMAINFDEVGWSSWIIAPHSYYANYCSGDCSWPLTDAQNATNHAIIQAIYHSVGRVVPKSCCAPVKLGRMAILYQLDGIVQMKQYDEMIVEACGCL